MKLSVEVDKEIVVDLWKVLESKERTYHVCFQSVHFNSHVDSYMSYVNIHVYIFSMWIKNKYLWISLFSRLTKVIMSYYILSGFWFIDVFITLLEFPWKRGRKISCCYQCVYFNCYVFYMNYVNIQICIYVSLKKYF